MTQRDVPSTPAGAASRPALQASRQRPFNRDGIGKNLDLMGILSIGEILNFWAAGASQLDPAFIDVNRRLGGTPRSTPPIRDDRKDWAPSQNGRFGFIQAVFCEYSPPGLAAVTVFRQKRPKRVMSIILD
jgi:hypothetical protein